MLFLIDMFGRQIYQGNTQLRISLSGFKSEATEKIPRRGFFSKIERDSPPIFICGKTLEKNPKIKKRVFSTLQRSLKMVTCNETCKNLLTFKLFILPKKRKEIFYLEDQRAVKLKKRQWIRIRPSASGTTPVASAFTCQHLVLISKQETNESIDRYSHIKQFLVENVCVLIDFNFWKKEFYQLEETGVFEFLSYHNSYIRRKWN